MVQDSIDKSDSVTFVTCLFELAPYDGYDKRRSIDQYLEFGASLLSQDIKIIVFIHEHLHSRLSTSISKFSSESNKIHVIPMKIEELPLWKDRHLFIKAKKPDLTNERFTPEYFLLTWSKMDLMLMAMHLNPFNSSEFIWIDFGISRVSQPDDLKMLIKFDKFKSQKFKICQYWTHVYPTCINKDYILSTIWSQTPAGLWMTNPENFKLVFDLFFEVSRQLLKSNRVALEEDILTYLRCKHSELFQPFYGTYESLIRSFCDIYSLNEWNLTQNLINLRMSPRPEDQIEGLKLASRTLNEIYSRKFTVSNSCFKLITETINILKNQRKILPQIQSN